MEKLQKIYVFNGNNSTFPSGVFTEYELALSWIENHKLSGILNLYPLDVGLYDWAISNNFFIVKTENQKKSNFIERFTCASIEHFHFVDGEVDE